MGQSTKPSNTPTGKAAESEKRRPPKGRSRTTDKAHPADTVSEQRGQGTPRSASGGKTEPTPNRRTRASASRTGGSEPSSGSRKRKPQETTARERQREEASASTPGGNTDRDKSEVSWFDRLGQLTSERLGDLSPARLSGAISDQAARLGDAVGDALGDTASRLSDAIGDLAPARLTELANTLGDLRPSRIGDLTSSALKIARRTTGNSVKVGKTLLKSQEQLKVMGAAGQSLKDLREVAGLTINDLSDAINLKDRTFWEAVEDGTATISFELILRLAALLARNDPIPFVLKYTRTYNPELWRILNDWGVGRLPLQYEREREFVNIYRRHDAARYLSDDGFRKVLAFTRQAFETSLHFAAEYEQLTRPRSREAQPGRSEGNPRGDDTRRESNGAEGSTRGTSGKSSDPSDRNGQPGSNSIG